MKRLTILSTHPIQYNAPLFRLIAADPDIELKVFYSKVTEEVRFDKDFGQEVTWDIPLTEGYAHESFSAASAPGRKRLIRAIEKFGPNAILVFGWNFDGHFAVMKHFRGKTPVWFRGDSTLIDPQPFWKKILRRAWLSWVYSKVDKVFYVGSANKRYFEWAGIKGENLIYAPHAVDNEFFLTDNDNRCRQADEIRSQLGIPNDAFVFLFVGKLESKKQPVELTLAFNTMISASTNIQCHLVIVGNGALSGKLKEETQTNQFVHSIGFVNQSLMPIYYRLANCLCLPSKGPGETWGLAVNEFLASTNGILLLSDRVGCAEDMIGFNDILVRWNDYENWPTKLKEALESWKKQGSHAEGLRKLATLESFHDSIKSEIGKL